MLEGSNITWPTTSKIQKYTILIVGYCSPETPGGELRAGAETIQLFDEEKVVRADIVIMDSFSAHGDKNEMYNFIENQKSYVKRIFLVHGELDTQNAFKHFLIDKGFTNIDIPAQGSEFNL
jgi:metallo-beta-lactamase family protein